MSELKELAKEVLAILDQEEFERCLTVEQSSCVEEFRKAVEGCQHEWETDKSKGYPSEWVTSCVKCHEVKS